MNIRIDYKGKDYKKIEKLILRAYKETEVFFDKKIDSINIKLHKTRNSFEKKLKRKTFDWEIANASYRNEIDILHPIAFDKESSHGKKKFLSVLKHEIIHLFVDKMTKGTAVPKWLDEGFSSFVSGQYKNIKKQNNYIEQNFCKKLGTSKGWNEYSNYCAYQTATLFIEFLVNKYSLNKIKKLISSLDKNYYYPDFQKIFTKTIGEDLEKLEKKFIKEINK